MGHCRVRPLGGDLSLESFSPYFSFSFGYLPPRTNVTLPFGFADKERTTPRLILINVQSLNFLLRSEIFVSEDGQLRAVPLILDYEPLSPALVDAGQAIKAGSPRLARIDVSIPGFLARRDLPPIQLPAQCILPKVVVLGEGTDSSHSSLEDQIDQFRFVEEGEVSAWPVELSDSDSDIDHSSVAPTLGLVIAQADTSQEVEEEGMDLKLRSSFRDLLSNRYKGQSSRDAPKEQATSKHPPHLPSATDPALQPLPNLKRKRPVEEVEEGKVGPEKAK